MTRARLRSSSAMAGARSSWVAHGNFWWERGLQSSPWTTQRRRSRCWPVGFEFSSMPTWPHRPRLTAPASGLLSKPPRPPPPHGVVSPRCPPAQPPMDSPSPHAVRAAAAATATAHGGAGSGGDGGGIAEGKRGRERTAPVPRGGVSRRESPRRRPGRGR